MGKREEKAATIKVKILQTTLDLLQSREFENIHVTEICKSVGISKVTFFKYFPQKEDIVFYYFRIWCLEQALSLRKKEKSGVKGLHFIFDQFAQIYIKYPSLIETFVSNLIHLKYAIKPIPVSHSERIKLFPNENDLGEVEIHPFGNMVEGFLLEAVLNKEITKFSDTVEMRNILLALLYGFILSAKLHQITDFRIQLKRSIDHMISAWQ